MSALPRRTFRRVVIWSLSLGCISALLAFKGATRFGASDLEDIALFFVGGCPLGCLIGLLTTAYNEKWKSLFHIWGWALLLTLLGLAFNTGTTRGFLLGALIGAVAGALIGSLLYLRVLRSSHSGAMATER